MSQRDKFKSRLGEITWVECRTSYLFYLLLCLCKANQLFSWDRILLNLNALFPANITGLQWKLFQITILLQAWLSRTDQYPPKQSLDNVMGKNKLFVNRCYFCSHFIIHQLQSFRSPRTGHFRYKFVSISGTHMLCITNTWYNWILGNFSLEFSELPAIRKTSLLYTNLINWLIYIWIRVVDLEIIYLTFEGSILLRVVIEQ